MRSARINISLGFLLISCFYSLEGQYISRVLEYVPAPSQYMNAAPWGTPSSARTIEGTITGTLSLGSFGGYVIFRFDSAVINKPENLFGIDFTIFGNPLPNWSEPGIVSVMKDENGNGEPDDTWYELAGSDYWFSTSKRNYEISYFNPMTDSATDIPWEDNYGASGYIEANSFFKQPYYAFQDSFPMINNDHYLLSGSFINSSLDSDNPSALFSGKRAFGYADNQFRGKAPYTVPDNPYTPEVENAGGDAFDLSWAVDGDGNYIELDSIHFIRVHTACISDAGWLGQLSTEITGASIVSASSLDSQNYKNIVIKDLPPELNEGIYQLEAVAFSNGRLMRDAEIVWQLTPEGNYIDNNSFLHALYPGEIEIRAQLAEDENIKESITLKVISSSNTNNPMFPSPHFYPNPVHDMAYLDAEGITKIEIFDLSGKSLLQFNSKAGIKEINVSSLQPGLYLVHFDKDKSTFSGKLIKN